MMDIEDITEVLAINLIGVVPEDEIIVVSTNRGEPAVTEYTSRAGEAYRRVARRLLGKKCRLWLWNIMKESSINSEKCWEWQPGKEEQDMAIWDLFSKLLGRDRSSKVAKNACGWSWCMIAAIRLRLMF